MHDVPSPPSDDGPDRAPTSAESDEAQVVAELLGREPMGGWQTVVRLPSGHPVVIRNEPLLHDGTPMPTRYWLVDPDLRTRVSRLEAAGGVRAADEAVDTEELDAAHVAYAEERDAALPPGWDGPVPSGGVGGTRVGVKCLHAHFAYYLAGGDDPVGRWVAERLVPVGEADPDDPTVLSFDDDPESP